MQPLTKIVCPHCHAILKSSKPLEPGKQVSCLKCRAPFSVSPSDLVAAGSVQEILVSATLADDADQVELAIDAPGDSFVVGVQPSAEIPVGVLERAVSVVDKTPVSAPYFPPPVAKSAVPIAAPFSPPPARNRGVVTAAFAGLLVFLGCGAALTWYCLQRNSAAEEQTAQGPNIPGPEYIADPKANPPEQQQPIAPKENGPNLDPKAKPASFEEPDKKEPEPKKPGLKQRIRPAPSFKLESTTSVLPEKEQIKVNEAIKQGIKFIKDKQLATGTWMTGVHSVGYAALPGLTLLECQVPPSDIAVQKAALHVRMYSQTLTDTYDLSLAVLFLDRLGERKDRSLIQMLALRLVAGQKESGGWDYQCPLLTLPEMNQLMLFLHQTRPKAATLLYPLPKDSSSRLTDPLAKPDSERFSDPLAKEKANRSKEKETKLIPPFDDGRDADPKKPKETKPKVLPKGSPKLKGPAFAKAGKRRLQPGRDDNSNTQFALLALWAARRHDVPSENSLTVAHKRFQTSQNKDGGWGYVSGFGTSDAMTGVGLLGLAMGHGVSEKGMLVAVDARANKTPAKANLQDPVIAKGLQTFGKYIGKPDPDNQNPNMVNCYFLWTLERVAMIYNLQTIGNKDWYRWGVHILLPNQLDNGSWFGGQYPGASHNLDTCFALLFLKRSNLVRDLTENLDLLLGITDPDADQRAKKR
ncbi:MAG TPA: hypothetical protein VKE98_02700 [Gemmataceae bacterium]|nr:hypothetical protein [Gemmataceae bacterium]